MTLHLNVVTVTYSSLVYNTNLKAACYWQSETLIRPRLLTVGKKNVFNKTKSLNPSFPDF